MLSSYTRSSTALTVTEERALEAELRNRAYKHCDASVKPWVECVQVRTVTAPFACREQIKNMKDCLHAFDTDAERAKITQEFLQKRTKDEKINNNVT